MAVTAAAGTLRTCLLAYMVATPAHCLHTGASGVVVLLLMSLLVLCV
jgi:hypothetical protein